RQPDPDDDGGDARGEQPEDEREADGPQQHGQESVGEEAPDPAGPAADGAGLGRIDGLRGGTAAVLEGFGHGHGGHVSTLRARGRASHPGTGSVGVGPARHRLSRMSTASAPTQPLSQISLSVARSSATAAASSANSASVIVPRRRVNTTSQRDSSIGSTRSGLSTDSPLGRVTVWSITPYSFSGTKLISTRPSGEFIDHWDTSRCTSPPARPAAQRGRFRGSLVNSYTARQGRSMTMSRWRETSAEAVAPSVCCALSLMSATLAGLASGGDWPGSGG